MEFVLKAEAEELKDVKKNPTMKLSVVFHSTYAKVKELLESNKPIRDGDWTNVEVGGGEGRMCVPDALVEGAVHAWKGNST